MKTKVIISKYFTLDDLVYSKTAEKNMLHEQWNVQAVVVNNLSNLCMYVLDVLKEEFPSLAINSGYRCSTLNCWVKGSKNSPHMKGQAVDIWAKDLDALTEHIKTMNVDQIIRYRNFVHVSFNLGYNRNQYIDKR